MPPHNSSLIFMGMKQTKNELKIGELVKRDYFKLVNSELFFTKLSGIYLHES